ncbi:MAG: HAD-IIB family hydrolase [Myxococcota bacterium]
MRPIADLPDAVSRGVRLMFCDIDDTLTTHGKLDREAFDALWRLRDAAIKVVPVTGRPAGWCDAIVRQWPVDAVVGENGAFVFHEVAGVLKARFHAQAMSNRDELAAVRDTILKEVPGSRVAKDQHYRLFDLAIDFAEEDPKLDLAAADRIRAIAERLGCVAKVSSIHVNIWLGGYDKLSMARETARHLFGIDDAALASQAFFVGDSPNDAPMFAAFPHSAGVANIARFVASMRHLPAYVASQPGGRGFAEVASVLLGARGVC